jgi:hypothetical protein
MYIIFKFGLLRTRVTHTNKKKANIQNIYTYYSPLIIFIFIFQKKFSDLADIRILSCLINSFVPNLFPTEILPNDR